MTKVVQFPGGLVRPLGPPPDEVSPNRGALEALGGVIDAAEQLAEALDSFNHAIALASDHEGRQALASAWLELRRGLIESLQKQPPVV